MTTPDRDTHRPRDGTGRFVRTVDNARRDAEAARLRAAGVTYGRIAEQLGYSDKVAAFRAVERVLAETVREPGDQLRELELQRLDALLLEAWAVLKRQHVAVSHGRIVRDEHGQPVRDYGPVLAAVDRALRISERRSRLLGLDAAAEDVDERKRHELTLRIAGQMHAVFTHVLGGLGLSEEQRVLVPELVRAAIASFTAGAGPREIEGEAV